MWANEARSREGEETHAGADVRDLQPGFDSERPQNAVRVEVRATLRAVKMGAVHGVELVSSVHALRIAVGPKSLAARPRAFNPRARSLPGGGAMARDATKGFF